MMLSFLSCGTQRGTAGRKGFYFSGLGELLPGLALTAEKAPQCLPLQFQQLLDMPAGQQLSLAALASVEFLP